MLLSLVTPCIVVAVQSCLEFVPIKKKSIEGLFAKHMTTDEIKNEIDEIKKLEEKIKRKNLKYDTDKYDFQ